MTTEVGLFVSSSCMPIQPFVLLVDDHELTLESLRQVVETAGHPCVAFSASPKALMFCGNRRPAVLVTDLAMPDLNGHDLACWFKARYPTVPIVLVTGEAIDRPTMQVLRGTFSAILTKPLAIERFLNLLDRLMTRGIVADTP